MEHKKVIYADDLKTAIRDDLTVRGPAFAAVMKHIDNAATVEVAPVVHGRWIKDPSSEFKHRYNCSVCNFRLVGEPERHCPGCGAIMDLPNITDAATAALERIGKNAHGVGGND